MKSCKTVPIGTSAATWQKPRLCAKLMFALLGAASAVAFAEAEVKDNDAEIVSAKTVAESGIVYTNGDITETCEETGDAIYDLVFTYVDKSTGVLPGTLYSLSLKCTMADMTLTTESIQTGTITADADSPATTEVLSTMLAPFLSGHALKQTATEPVAVWTVAKAVASVGGFNYASLDDAIAAASDGATVTVVDDIGVAGTLADLSLNKSVTLVKGEGTNPTIRNYNFLCNGADSAIAVKGLTFAGTCMFRLQNCTSFTMEDCVANVTPYRAKTCVDGHSSGGNAGHPVFIHLGSGTATEGFDYAAPVSLTLKNNTIVPSNGTDGGDQISGLVYNQYDNIAWGYRHVADGSLIDGNTFYSAALPSTWCSFALMGAPATGAVVTFKNNTFYGTTKVYVYSPLDGKLFNADSILTGPMTWVSSGNAFNVDKSGTYGYGVYTVESGCAARVAILDDGTSTVNGSAVTLADCIDDSGKSGVGGFILLNGVKDADGKYTAGLLSRSMSDADKAIFLPEGFATVASATAEGRYEIGYDLPTGTGTKADPWVIDSRRHLKGFRNAVNDGTFATAGTYTIQTVDIDLEGEQWTDIGTGLTAAKLIAFNGCYDGQGHKISNLVLSGQSYCGFFAASEQGVFRNMSFVNVTSPADCPAVSVVVGDVEPAGSQKVVFDNITMSGSIFGKHNVGSISAWLQGTVEILNCTNLVNCTSTRAKVGGFAPYYGGTAGTDSLLISNCCNKGTVTLAKSVAADATSAAGGILAYAQSTAPVTFVDCVNEGEIVGTIETKDPSTEKYFGTTNLGGIMGCITGGLTATFTNCENSGSVSATVANVAQNAAVGGILGNVADGGATVALTGNLVTTDTTLTAEVASGKTAGAGAFVGDLATDNQTTLGAGNKAKATLAPFGSAKTVVGLGIGYTNGDYTEYCAEDGDSIYRLVMANVNMSTGVLPGTLYSYSLKCTMSGMTLTPESIQTGTITGDADSPATTEILSTMLAPFLSGHMLKQTATDPVKVWTVARLVASVGGGNYDSLEAAFAAAKAGETVKLLADVAYTGSANIAVAPDGRALVFDLNGKTVTSATGYVLVNFGTLEVKDSSEGAAGKVVCTQGTLLRNFGNLTLTSGTLEIGTPGNYSVVKNDEDPGDAYPQKVGAFTMNGGALKAPATGRAIQAWTSMTVNGGTVDGSIQAWSYNGNTCGKQATITINGGTFNGAVESITYKGSTTASVVDIYGGAFNGALTVTSNGAAESKIVVHTYAADGTTPNNANFASDASAYCESGWGTVLDANTSRYVLGKAAAPGEPIVVEAATAEEALAKTALNIKSPDAKVVSQDSYKAYFTKKATAGEGGTWVVTAELKPEIVKAEDETSELAEDLGDIASGAVTSVSLTNAKPGLFYSAKYTDDVSGMGSASESTRKMANANGAVEIETPKILDSTKMFYQIQVNVTK